MNDKAQLLVTAPELPSAELVQALAIIADRAATHAPAGSRVRVAVRCPGDPAAATPQDGQVAAGPAVLGRPSFDGLVDVRAADSSVPVGVFEGAAATLGGLIDPTRSAALVGVEQVVIAGERPLLLVMTLRRQARFTVEEFHRYWLDEHGRHVLETVPDLAGYRQFHADPVASRQAADLAGVSIADFDGTAEGYFDSLETFAEIMARPAVAADAGFIDHAASVVYLYDVSL